MAKRKIVTMLVTVSVPSGTTAAEARREVRTLINNQSNYSLDFDEVKCRQIKPARC